MNRVDRVAIVPLALLLIVLLGIWLGAIGPVSDGSWVGMLERWQTLIGAIFAIGAAYWIGRPVYQQLKEMRRQSAVQTFEVLRSLSVTLSNEARIVEMLIREARNTSSVKRTFDEQKQSSTVAVESFFKTWVAELDERLEALVTLRSEFEISGVHRWGDDRSISARLLVSSAITELLHAIATNKVQLLDVWQGALVDSTQKLNAQHTGSEAADRLSSRCRNFSVEIAREQNRLSPLIARARADCGIG